MPRAVRAARLVEHGAPVVVEQVRLAEPGPDEVVVDVVAAGVNPIDHYNALGRVAADGPLPRTLGGEAAGLLDGRLVVVAGSGLGSTRDGVYAEAVVVPRVAVVPVPDGVPADTAACCGVAGLTAWNVLQRSGAGPGTRVLVLGAGGGVGLPLVSLCATIGADVHGQVGPGGAAEVKADAVRRAGAVRVHATDARGLAAALGDWRPEVVLDPLGGPFVAPSLAALVPHGRYVVYGTSAGAEITTNWQTVYRNGLQILGYAGLRLTAVDRAEGIHQALLALADGRMSIPVAASYGLDGLGAAFDALGSRSVTGKLVLTP